MNKKLALFDALMAACLLIALNPAITGFSFHEWFGLVTTLVIAMHVGIRLPELGRQARSLSKPAAFGDFLVGALLFLDVALCAVSGIMVSGSALAAFGLYAPGYFVWNPLHAFTAKAMLALVIIHVALHWPRFKALLKR